MDHRKTLISSAEHMAAERLLGTDYTDEEYVVAVEAAREAGVGEIYADGVLGVDVDRVIKAVRKDDEDATVTAAERRLRDRGIDPGKATYQEYRDALVEVSS